MQKKDNIIGHLRKLLSDRKLEWEAKQEIAQKKMQNLEGDNLRLLKKLNVLERCSEDNQKKYSKNAESWENKYQRSEEEQMKRIQKLRNQVDMLQAENTTLKKKIQAMSTQKQMLEDVVARRYEEHCREFEKSLREHVESNIFSWGGNNAYPSPIKKEESFLPQNLASSTNLSGHPYVNNPEVASKLFYETPSARIKKSRTPHSGNNDHQHNISSISNPSSKR